MSKEPIHERWMREALALAREAASADEVPVGAVVVCDGEVVGRGSNQTIGLIDPSAHAEMVAIRQAAAAVGNYRLAGCDLYVTLEPCVMCAGLLVNARIRSLIFGARDLRFGGVRSKFQLADSPLLNHRVEVVEGVLGEECTRLLRAFFQVRRDP
ncbi:MAG: tRNA adenosine(34) deaminase TadA [Bryobacterales bacterium]|jgi:tRNA(adenine34) deaminase|nr:tRNA adenosine(34) deaminase TadA [Bryobacterales bacterium]